MTETSRSATQEARRRLRSTAVRGALLGDGVRLAAARSRSTSRSSRTSINARRRRRRAPSSRPATATAPSTRPSSNMPFPRRATTNSRSARSSMAPEACAPVDVAGGVPGEAAGRKRARRSRAAELHAPARRLHDRQRARRRRGRLCGRPVYSDSRGGIFSSDGRPGLRRPRRRCGPPAALREPPCAAQRRP